MITISNSKEHVKAFAIQFEAMNPNVCSMIASPADLQCIIGKRPWHVWKGVGSFMLFEFGRPRRNEDGSKSGTYTLWIYMADWRILKDRKELAHSESPDTTIHRAAEALTAKKLECVVLRAFIEKRKVRHGVALNFEEGCSLQAWAYPRGRADEDVFMLYTPSTFITYGRDGTLVSEPSKRK